MNAAALPFRALSRQSLADGVAEQIRRAVIDATLAEGALVPEGQLAARLGTSRGPVREALFQLEREGLVVFDARGRARVRALAPADFEELFTLRLALETMSARWAAERLAAADLAAMEENLRQSDAAPTLADLGRLDIEFHDLVMRAARHERLLTCWRTIHRQVEWWIARNYRTHAAKAADTRRIVMAAQRKLFKAISSGNPKKAVAEMTEHIGRWRDLLPS
jgi:DNA-binding GntR family transcriptional regulator